MNKVVIPKLLLGLGELTFLFVYFGANDPNNYVDLLILNLLVLIGLYYLINRFNKVELQKFVQKTKIMANKSSRNIFFTCQNCNNKAIRGDSYCQNCGAMLSR